MNIRRSLARLACSLPPSLIIRMAGGTQIEIDGRALEPQLQLLAWNGRKAPALAGQPAHAVQQAVKAQFALIADRLPETVSFRELKIPGRDSHVIPARLYTPSVQEPSHPLLVYFHMGGGVVGDLETCHAFCGLLSERGGMPVLSVDYRLAPQHRYPAGLNDCIDAYLWGVTHAAEFGAPAHKAAIGGDSMGGNFAAIIAQKMKAEAGPVPVLQLLIYPAIDMSVDYPSRARFANTFSLSSQMMEWFMSQYLPDGASLCETDISPGQQADLSGLPPAIVITAGHDPLVDEGDNYAVRLREAGVAVMHQRHDSLAHAFTAFTLISPGSRAACKDIAHMVAQMYGEME